MNAQFTPRNPMFQTLRFALFTLFCAGLVAFATAQSTPGSSTPNSVTPQNPQTATHGWMWFDQKTGSAMALDQATMEKLHAVDDNYRQRYTALGATPWTAEGYDVLTLQREKEVKGILTPQMYEMWVGKYGSQRPMGTVTPQEKTGTSAPRK